MAWSAGVLARPPALVTVVGAPGSRSAPVAVSLARALAALAERAADVVLADLVLDAPHRALHALDPDAPGLSELIAASRFGPPPDPALATALHPTGAGYRVLPGVQHHHDWIGLGERAAATALDAVRAAAPWIVAHTDRDLEGEPDTGSFDIADRNVLARTAVAAADLVVVAAGDDRAGRLGALSTLQALARYGVPTDRTLLVLDPTRVRARPVTPEGANVLRLGRGRRVDLRLGAAVLARLVPDRGSGGPPGPDSAGGPEPIVPGSLGSCDHDIEGWITPRTPQQP